MARKPAEETETPRRRTRPTRPTRPSGATRKPTSLEAKLEEFFSGTALVVMAMGQPEDARIIAQQAKPMAVAWGDLARENSKVKEILERIITGGAWGGVIMVTMSVAVPIAHNHGLYPEGWPMPFTLPEVPDAPPLNGDPSTPEQQAEALKEAEALAERMAESDERGSGEPPPSD